MSTQDSMQRLANRLLDARREKTTLAVGADLPEPADVDSAHAAQWLTIDALGGAAGFKLGARTPEAEPQYAPLPASKVFADGATLVFGDFARVGLELEIGFRFKETLDAAAAQLSDAAIVARIDTMHVTIEIVDSRYAGFPETPKLLQLADLQNNGALVVGEGLPYRPDFDYLAPRATFRCGDLELFSGPAHNPCGDPRRLVPWAVRAVLRHGRSIGAGDILTAGSYTGCRFVDTPGRVEGEIEGLGALSVTLS
jgi:2-keto-4-pentenoate hydratase